MGESGIFLSPYTDFLLHVAPTVLGGAVAGGIAWAGVRWEQRSMRRALRRVEKAAAWSVHTLLQLSQAHNENHPESKRIDVSELSKILFDGEKRPWP